MSSSNNSRQPSSVAKAFIRILSADLQPQAVAAIRERGFAMLAAAHDAVAVRGQEHGMEDCLVLVDGFHILFLAA